MVSPTRPISWPFSAVAWRPGKFGHKSTQLPSSAQRPALAQWVFRRGVDLMRIKRVAGSLAIPVMGMLAFASSEPVRAEARDPVGWFKSTTQMLVDAVTTGDKGGWDRILDAHCIITTEDGVVLDKARFLEELRPLPPGFTGTIKVRDLAVRQAGSAAVVHYWLDESE